MNCNKPWKNLFNEDRPKHRLSGTYLLFLSDIVETLERNQEVKLVDYLFCIRGLKDEVLIDVYSTTNNINHNFNFPVKHIDLDSLSVEQHVELNCELLGDEIIFLLKSKKDFIVLSENCDLNNYIIWFISLEAKYVSISFIPKVDTFVNGVPFQIASQGDYKYGRGYEFIYDAVSGELLDTIGMR